MQQQCENPQIQLCAIGSVDTEASNGQKLFSSSFQHTAISRPTVRDLPPEVLNVIFELLCSWSGSVITVYQIRIFSVPVKLSQVCSSWRELVYSSPWLWSSLYVKLSPFPSRHNHLFDGIKSLITTHLELSQDSPLNLDITSSASQNKVNNFIMESILMHVHRWRTVRFSPHLQLPASIQLGSSSSPVPLLHTLKLGGQVKDHDDNLVLDVFANAPRLRVLEISYELVELKVPWERITDYRIVLAHTAPALKQASLAINVPHLTFARCYWDTDDDDDEPDHVIHNCSSLSIVIDREDSGFFSLLQWLTLPRLTCLHISGDETSKPSRCYYSDIHFPAFLSRSSCIIASLSLVDIPMTDTDAMSFIFSMTSLSALIINERRWTVNGIITTRFLKALTLSHASTEKNLCFLQHLDLQFHARFPAKHIIDLVQSRWILNHLIPAQDGVDALKCIRIDVLMSKAATDFDIDELNEAMKIYKASGLQFFSSRRFLENGCEEEEDEEDEE